jgi:hypothetical protein
MRTQFVAIVCAVAYTVSACAPVANNAAAQVQPLAPIRVILQLHNSTTAFDSTAFLQQLQAHTAAPAHYLASVSNDTHVYSIAPKAGQTYAQMLEQLRSMPAVLRVSLDQKVPLQ